MPTVKPSNMMTTLISRKNCLPDVGMKVTDYKRVHYMIGMKSNRVKSNQIDSLALFWNVLIINSNIHIFPSSLKNVEVSKTGTSSAEVEASTGYNFLSKFH